MSAVQRNLVRLAAVMVSFAVAFGLSGIGQARLIPSASAATVYETTVKDGVNLRSGAGTNYRVIRFLPAGESVHVISKVDGYWLKVQDKKGNVGYVSASSQYTNYGGSSAVSDSSSKADQVVAIAKSYMGRVKYDFGVRNPSRLIFDCSSFTEFVFAKVGVSLRWGTRYQKTAGSFASKSSLRKGDLVFFDTIGGNNKVINHVGIYIGGGQFIHDTPTVNGLAINSLSSGYWSQHYVTARRVL